MLTVAAGKPFDVKLGAGPTTGYVWQLESLPAGVQLLESNFRLPPAVAIGDGGVQVFRLQANQSGRFSLQFQLKRQWETSPIRTEVVEVDAR